MSFIGRFNAEMSDFAKSMKKSAENCRLEGKIAEQEKTIRALTKEITNLVLVRLEAGDEMCPEIMERYAAIREAKAAMEALEEEKHTAKAVCPSCGAKTSAEMKYCGMCGAKMAKEERE